MTPYKHVSHCPIFKGGGAIPLSGIVKAKHGLSLSLTGPLLSSHSNLETEEQMIPGLSFCWPCTWWSVHNQTDQRCLAEYWIFQEVKKEKKIKERPTFGTQGTLKTEEALACSW